MTYTIERNQCQCHPETCGCDPWNVMQNGTKWVTCYTKEKAERLVELLDQAKCKN